MSGKQILGAMMGYVWPKDDEMIRKRVMLSLGLLIGAKIINVGVPFIFKAAVDGAALLSVASAPEAVLATTVSLVIGCKDFISERMLSIAHIFCIYRWCCSLRIGRFQ